MKFNLSTTLELLDKSLGLSLSDPYWISPSGSEASWSTVNFFDNPFSDEVGNVLFGNGLSGECISLMSPDNTTGGWLKKKWTIFNGKRCLMKGGSGATQQEPYNEVIASRIMARLGIPHVPYTLMVQDDDPYSVCENFITPETELITAWHCDADSAQAKSCFGVSALLELLCGAGHSLHGGFPGPHDRRGLSHGQ